MTPATLFDDSQRVGIEDSSVSGHYAVSVGKWSSAFQKNVVPLSRTLSSTLLGLIDSEYGDTIIHQNVGNHLTWHKILEDLNLYHHWDVTL